MSNLKEGERICSIKDEKNFIEVVDCCRTCLNATAKSTGEYTCDLHDFTVFGFSLCDDYKD